MCQLLATPAPPKQPAAADRPSVASRERKRLRENAPRADSFLLSLSLSLSLPARLVVLVLISLSAHKNLCAAKSAGERRRYAPPSLAQTTNITQQRARPLARSAARSRPDRLLWLVAAEAGNGDGLDVPERGLQVSPFMMFMLFMGMVYVVLTLQQRATRQVKTNRGCIETDLR